MWGAAPALNSPEAVIHSEGEPGMRLNVMWVVVLGLLAGCAARQSALGIPEGEPVYALPLEEAWPNVRQFFTDNQLPFREDPGSFVLETEWREEFRSSKIAAFWHRYMVLGKRETPTTSKVWVIRVTRSANDTLQQPGAELVSWGVGNDAMDTVDNVGGSKARPTDSTGFDFIRAGGPARDQLHDGENGIHSKSAQSSRDLVMEWRVFHGIESKLEEQAEAARAKQEARDAQLAAAAAKRSEVLALKVECGMPIIGLAPRAKAGAVLLMGELHGTQEVPRFLAQSACQAAVAGTPVTVGLELPVENQERVERFLASAGAEEDWLKLMEAPFWRSPFPDGRSSEAVANLLEQLRALKAHGLDVRAFVFDHPQLKGQVREDAMTATVLQQVKGGPERFYMVVSGNVHPRTVQGLPWDRQYRPMGLLLSEALDEDDVVALDMAYDSGSAWICAADPKAASARLECGVRPARGRDNGDRPFIHLFGDRTREGFHGVFYVGKVTASVPAINRGQSEAAGSQDRSQRKEGGEGTALATRR
jgi:hypothetical protein